MSKKQPKPKRQRKQKISHAPRTTAAYKEAFLKLLEHCVSPNYAAKQCGIGHTTIYHWKKHDLKFAEAWETAIKVGVGRVETAMFKRAIAHSDSNAQFIMKAHMPELYGRRESTSLTANVQVRMTVEETRERLRELGIEFPMVIEGDFTEEDVTVPRITDATSRSDTDE
jgi:hypothetical protein